MTSIIWRPCGRRFRSGDFAPWCNITLSFIRQTAESNIGRLDKLSVVSASWSEQLAGTRRDSALHRMLPWMLTKPAFT
jgi:cell filamentation protein, protein adenylyltransferase